MRAIRFSQTPFGGPMVELDAAPKGSDGMLSVSDELVAICRPLLGDGDHVAVRFTSPSGMPTTATVVLAQMSVEVQERPRVLRWYDVRIIIFDTTTGMTGMNLTFKPISVEMADTGVGQHIKDGPSFRFVEVYNDGDALRDDLERLLATADAAYSKTRSALEEAPIEPEVQAPTLWRRLFG